MSSDLGKRVYCASIFGDAPLDEVLSMLTEVKELEAENKQLRELLIASLPALRSAYKSGYDLCPYDGTDLRFIRDQFGTVSLLDVYDEVRQVLGVE